jgi:2-keto-4-pentenoate hydratase/2-oxohepta-3-ene-1,7-dioic acid hydratase in catechol pathway
MRAPGACGEGAARSSGSTGIAQWRGYTRRLVRLALVAAPSDPTRTRVGAVREGRVHLLPEVGTIVDLLGDDGERLHAAGERALRDPAEVLDIGAVHLLPPVPVPPSVRDFYAFEQHVRTARQKRGLEMDPDWYELPVFYFSNPRAVIGDGVDVAIPPGSSELDYELEVAAVVGRGGRDLTPEHAQAGIAGYCVMNDWSARDLQRREMRLSMGPVKGKDFATSLGPVLVTPDELDDRRSGAAFDLAMLARVNGEEWSRASLADIHWSFGEMLAYASRGTELVPGDVIGSGTCGTGCILELALVHGSERYPWLKPGDVVELEVERLGTLHNRVVAGIERRPLRPGGTG